MIKLMVVEDEGLLGKALDEAPGDRQVPRVGQDVVGELQPGELGDPAAKILAQQELVIGLVLHDVPQADELLASSEAGELACDVAGAEVRPAHDSPHEVELASVSEQPARFLEGLAGLDGDAAVHLERVELRLQVAGGEISAQDLHALADPGVLAGFVAPEVLVCVDAHGPRA